MMVTWLSLRKKKESKTLLSIFVNFNAMKLWVQMLFKRFYFDVYLDTFKNRKGHATRKGDVRDDEININKKSIKAKLFRHYLSVIKKMRWPNKPLLRFHFFSDKLKASQLNLCNNKFKWLSSFVQLYDIKANESELFCKLVRSLLVMCFFNSSFENSWAQIVVCQTVCKIFAPSLPRLHLACSSLCVSSFHE